MLIKFKSWLRKKISFYKLSKTIKEMLRLQKVIQGKEFEDRI